MKLRVRCIVLQIWDCEGHVRKKSFSSGHHNNIFQARALPFTNNEKVPVQPLLFQHAFDANVVHTETSDPIAGKDEGDSDGVVLLLTLLRL